MPTSFDWYMRFSAYEESIECDGRDICREQAARTFSYYASRKFNIIAACEENQLRVLAKTSTYRHGSKDVIAFVQRWYPVTAKLSSIISFDGVQRRILEIEGNHFVVNAWWWATLYFRLIHNKIASTSSDPTDRLMELLLGTRSESDSTVWASYWDRSTHIAALDRLIAGKEKPLYLNRFYSGPVNIERI